MKHLLLANLLMTVCAVAPAEDRLISNWDALVEKELSASKGKGATEEQYVLSLERDKETYTKGKVWLISHGQRFVDEGPYRRNVRHVWARAYKGYYKFFTDPNDEENLILRLSMTKRYDFSDGWDLQIGFEKHGCYLDMPITDDKIPDDPILVTTDAFWSDAKGTPYIRREERGGLLGKLGATEVWDCYQCEFISLGTTLRTKKKDIATTLKTLFGEKLPPGFKVKKDR